MPDSDEESMRRIQNRVEAGDPRAIFNLGCEYRDGRSGLPQDMDKMLELWHLAGEKGCAAAFCFIGMSYNNGKGIEVDKEKAKHYWELASMLGDCMARRYLGMIEESNGNIDRALKHYMIALKGGNAKSLERFKVYYLKGYATKEDYTNALQTYQAYVAEIKSVQRDKVASADENDRYY